MVSCTTAPFEVEAGRTPDRSGFHDKGKIFLPPPGTELQSLVCLAGDLLNTPR